MAIAIALHLLAAVYWVGGMVVMLVAVRPAAVALLDPPLRLPLLSAILSRFFIGVWVALAILLGTGLWMLFSAFGGFAHVGVHVHAMLLLFLLMVAIFIYLFISPYSKINRAVDAKNLTLVGAKIEIILTLVMTNATLGVITIIIGGAGRYLQ